jgi:hypothetical protein
MALYCPNTAQREVLSAWATSKFSGKASHWTIKREWLTSQDSLAPDQTKVNAELWLAAAPRPGICSLLLSPFSIEANCNCQPDAPANATCEHVRGLATYLLSAEAPQQSAFAKDIESRLGRPLAETESYFLQKSEVMLEKRLEQISAAELLPPQHRKGADRFLMVRAWPKERAPQTSWDAFLLLGQAAKAQGLLPPAFAEFLSADAVSVVEQRVNRPEFIKTWNARMANLECAQQPSPKRARAELKLCLRMPPPNQKASASILIAGTHQVLRAKDVEDIHADLTAFRDELDPVSRLLAREAAQSSQLGTVSLSRLPSLLKGLLRLKLPLHETVLNHQGHPLVWHEVPLRWEQRIESVEGSLHQDYLLELRDTEGNMVSEAVAILPEEGGGVLYVTATAVWHLAVYPFAEPLPLPVRIPGEVIVSKAGSNFFRRLDLAPPSDFEQLTQRYREIDVTIEVELWTSGGSTLCLVMRSNADGYAPTREFIGDYDISLGSKYWVDLALKVDRTKQDVVVIVNRQREAPAKAWLGLMQWSWYAQDGLWRLYITPSKHLELIRKWLQDRPPFISIKLRDELAGLLEQEECKIDYEVNLKPVSGEKDWFDTEVVVTSGALDLTREEISLLLLHAGQWVYLKGKGYRRAASGDRGKMEEDFAKLGMAMGAGKQRLHALVLAPALDKGFVKGKHEAALRKRVSEGIDLTKPTVPDSVKAELRPYQIAGFEFLAYLTKNKFGGVLADDMGLGKTLQTLTWLAWLRATQPKLGPFLVVCPKSVVENWANEAKRFIPHFSVERLTSTTVNVPQVDLVIINHTQLRLREQLLTAYTWGAVVIDEAQAIKNPTSQVAVAACQLKAENRLALTGTPIENRLLDLWSIFQFAMPNMLGSRQAFIKEFDARDDRFSRTRLSARVRPFLLRRTKSEVAKDLPERIEEDLLVELEDDQRLLYDAELKLAQMMLLKLKTPKELDKQRFNILASMLRLRQICCDPRLLDKAGKKQKKGGELEPSAKVLALLEQVEPIIERGEKVLIFSQFVEMLDLLRKQLEEQEIDTFYLTGQTENRGDLVQKFQEHASGAAFLISLKAGGSGLNLTAASYVIIFDPWWNPAVENQAIDRSHRIGQQNTVFAYRLVTKNTIEEKIRELQRSKAALADDVLGEEAFGQALSKTDFEYLFS